MLAGLSVVLMSTFAITPTASAAGYPSCVGTAVITVSGKSITVPTVVTSGKVTIKCVLGKGNSSSAVKALQNAAIKCYALSVGSVGADGIFGTVTTAAVKSIQKKGGLTGSQVDGVYGPVTHGVTKFSASCINNTYIV